MTIHCVRAKVPDQLTGLHGAVEFDGKLALTSLCTGMQKGLSLAHEEVNASQHRQPYLGMRDGDEEINGCKGSHITDGAVQKLVLEAGVALASQTVHQAVLHLLQHAHAAHPLPTVPYPPCTCPNAC